MSDWHCQVECCGSQQWPRFVLRDCRGKTWTGDGWTNCAHDAVLFNDETEATQRATELNRRLTHGLFVTHMGLSVESDKPFSVEQLKEYLTENFRGLLLAGQFENAHFEVRVDWSDLNEIRFAKDDHA